MQTPRMKLEEGCAFSQADFDYLASSNKSVIEAALLEAEAIKTVVEVSEPTKNEPQTQSLSRPTSCSL